MNFNLACGQALQKYDHEREQERAKFDLERDEALRKFIAACLGVKLNDSPSKSPKQSSSNEQKQTMTRQDIMRDYKK